MTSLRKTPWSVSLSLTLRQEALIVWDSDVHVTFNMFWEALDFELPVVTGRGWSLAADTAQRSPHDIADPGSDPKVPRNNCRVEARSIVVLMNRIEVEGVLNQT